MAKASFFKKAIDYVVTALADLAGGDILQLSDGRAGVVEGLNPEALKTGEKVNVTTGGIFKVTSATGTLFSAGDPVYWDKSANLAVPASAALNGSEDFYLGTAAAAKVSGQLFVQVDFNAGFQRLRPFVYEFDCETGVDSATHTLIPASMNPTGLQILSIIGIVSEVYAGGDQDQGIVTVKDTAASPNTLCTLTPSDAGADAAGDVIQGASAANAILSATGVAVKTVAAGLGVTGAVTQATAGAGAAGKMKVYIMAVPLA